MLHRNIFLLLGSNSGDRFGHLRLAIELVGKEIGEIITKSKVYETAPWGKANQPYYLNQVIKIESPLLPNELLVKVQSIERMLGRIRVEKWSERSIDIDIIYFGDRIVDRIDLVIPHPHIAERKFVLVPLAEISSDFMHPVLQKSNAELLKECNDTLAVKEFIS